MKTLEATTKIGGLNQHLLMQQSRKRFPYIKPHRHKDDDIDTFLSLAPVHDGTIVMKLIFGSKTLRTDVYVIGFNPGLNIDKVLQDRFCD